MDDTQQSVSDADRQRASTPAATLEEHITNSNIPKNEAEWWACWEIRRLRDEIERLRRAAPPVPEDVRRAALEEAAKECDAGKHRASRQAVIAKQNNDEWLYTKCRGREDEASELAIHIRALLPQSPSDGEAR